MTPEDYQKAIDEKAKEIMPILNGLTLSQVKAIFDQLTTELSVTIPLKW